MFDAKYKSSYVNSELYSKVDDFWKWFDYKRLDIENAIKEGNKNILSEISEELKKVYSGKVVYFALGYKDEKYILYLYYKRSSFLLTVGDTLVVNMPKYLKDSWICSLSK